MEQLSGLDSLLLFEERGNTLSHVCGLGIYHPRTAPGGKVRFRSILDYFEQRLPGARIFRQRLAEVPHGLDRPYWINDPDVDVEYHVRHIALPYPGDWRQLMIQVARLHSRPLDHNMPLWEVYVIEGLENIPELPAGSFAVVFKFHAAGLSGQTIGHAIRLLHSDTARGEDSQQPPHHAMIAEREPGTLALYGHAALNYLQRAWRLTRNATGTTTRLARLGAECIGDRLRADAANQQRGCFQAAPKTRFNVPLSSARVLECIELPLADIEIIRQHTGNATVNDVFLATLGGALRSYLSDKEELPAASLQALVPVTLREPGFAGSVGPSAFGMPIPLRTDLKDPLQRVRAVHAENESAHHGMLARIGRSAVPGLLSDLPHASVDLVIRHGLLPQVNCLAAQFDGSAAPMYLAGAEAIAFYPVGRAVDKAALNVSAFSYRDSLWLGITACRQALPDPAVFASAVRASFAELLRAATRKAAAPAKPRAKRAA